jgi:hypothetical protein
MDNDKETEKTEETKLRDLTPEKDAKGGGSADRLSPAEPVCVMPARVDPTSARTPVDPTSARRTVGSE